MRNESGGEPSSSKHLSQCLTGRRAEEK